MLLMLLVGLWARSHSRSHSRPFPRQSGSESDGVARGSLGREGDSRNARLGHGTGQEQSALLYYSYATERSATDGLLACRPLRALILRLLNRVNSLGAVVGPWWGDSS